MPEPDLEKIALRNVRNFTLFRVFFTARFYYPVYAVLFLDYGLSWEQFGVLNAVWAATIVLAEVPSGALADTIGRRTLLILTGILMVLEMAVLLAAPIGGGSLLFYLFLANRVLSGLAEAAASGADEALTFDSLKAAGMEQRWGHVLERVQRDTSLAFFFAMTIGAAVYDPEMVNAVLNFLGAGFHVEQSQLVKMPILLTMLSGMIVFAMALRMRETNKPQRVALAETIRESGRKTLAAGRWIWKTPLPFGIILAAMVIDSVIRQFLTMASEYWKVIEYPIASYGLIGSGMALLGLFVPRIARLMSDRNSPVRNFLYTSSVVLVGLAGLAMAIPYWGILPAVLLYASIQLTGFFVSRYLNEVADSEQRATVLSFRGLSTNVSYGLVSLLFSGLIASIKLQEVVGEYATEEAFQNAVFVDALAWFAPWFALTVVMVFVAHRLRFGRK
ncbi:MFS transporter [Coraliomargarita sinensis]|uniref:MFS transporter n=1 Tax=Coraliomargarita sinensis TaxID=2174842 RepID=A0A317ZH85_9BACT|nr:MFS transporter [Coraliomargarita sinensis]PXA03593.1 MFS transporter [Coraliomargarita sinensis]